LETKIRDQSTLNVRILTRSPLARADFYLFKSFGKRLLFGMSLPTLRNDLAKVYEPKAPAPSQRLAALRAAKEAGLHVYVAMAPTYPECDETDLRATLTAVAELGPLTIFHEPINIRAENVARIEAQAANMGVRLRTEVFATRESWQDYAVKALHIWKRFFHSSSWSKNTVGRAFKQIYLPFWVSAKWPSALSNSCSTWTLRNWLRNGRGWSKKKHNCEPSGRILSLRLPSHSVT
jgi:DNA repair photolyase